MKLKRSATLGCKDVGVMKSEFVARTQFLRFFFLLWTKILFSHISSHNYFAVHPRLVTLTLWSEIPLQQNHSRNAFKAMSTRELLMTHKTDLLLISRFPGICAIRQIPKYFGNLPRNPQGIFPNFPKEFGGHIFLRFWKFPKISGYLGNLPNMQAFEKFLIIENKPPRYLGNFPDFQLYLGNSPDACVWFFSVQASRTFRLI